MGNILMIISSTFMGGVLIIQKSKYMILSFPNPLTLNQGNLEVADEMMTSKGYWVFAGELTNIEVEIMI